MAEPGRAIMLGIRHRCGQEIQFWIPAELVVTISQRLDQHTDTEGLAEWMREEGHLTPEEQVPPEALVDRLRSELAPRAVHLIHVDTDESVCPSCGALLRWLDILVEYVRNSTGEAES